jgi:hypothetical protein
MTNDSGESIKAINRKKNRNLRKIKDFLRFPNFTNVSEFH